MNTYEKITAPACELCGRIEAKLTRHHLIPRTRHNNRRIRRQYSRNELQSSVLRVCRPCHNHVHDVLSEKELADNYNTREKIISHPAVAQFVAWLQSKPADFKPRSFAMKNRSR